MWFLRLIMFQMLQQSLAMLKKEKNLKFLFLFQIRIKNISYRSLIIDHNLFLFLEKCCPFCLLGLFQKTYTRSYAAEFENYAA